MAVTVADELGDVLRTLRELVSPGDRHKIAQLGERLAAKRLRVLVAGEAKRGKSTLVNALLGRDVVPTGVTPVTAVVTAVLPRDDDHDEDHLVVTFLDGRHEWFDLSALGEFVSERANPGNTRQVADVRVRIDSPFLSEHDVELVDTPGAGSVFAHNTLAAEQALDSLDAAIFVLTSDPPVSESERALLARVTAGSVRTFVVLNKADRLDAAELAEATEFTERVCASASGAAVHVYPCVARAGADDQGFVAFVSAFDGYLRQSARDDLVVSLRGHLSRLITRMLDGVAVTDRALELAESSAAGRVRGFQDRLREIGARKGDLGDRCAVAQRRLRRVLDESHRLAVGELAASCLQATLDQLDGPLRAVPADQVEERGRGFAVEVIREVAERWRRTAAARLEAGLIELRDQALADLAVQRGLVHDAARDFLDLEVSVEMDEQILLPSKGFWYSFDRAPVVEPPLADAARRVMPGKARRARDHLAREVPELVDRQLGRVRADLQQRLRESARRLARDLEQQHAGMIDRLLAALGDAARISDTARTDRVVQLAELRDRRETLRQLLAQVTRVRD